MNINEVELSLNLALNATRDELLFDGHIEDESEMYENNEDGDIHYRNFVQDIFDKYYDYFYDEINKCKKK